LLPAKRFTHGHIDIVGPLLASSGGCTHLLTMVDMLCGGRRQSRWSTPPLPAVQAAFFKSWVSLFGVSAFLTLDRSMEFSSAVWSEMCSTLGISHRLTTAFHSQANGLEERIHRPLKDALRVRLDNHWPSHLPWVLLGLRAAVKKIAPFHQQVSNQEAAIYKADFVYIRQGAVAPCHLTLLLWSYYSGQLLHSNLRLYLYLTCSNSVLCN
jgi:hypothetical protein